MYWSLVWIISRSSYVKSNSEISLKTQMEWKFHFRHCIHVTHFLSVPREGSASLSQEKQHRNEKWLGRQKPTSFDCEKPGKFCPWPWHLKTDITKLSSPETWASRSNKIKDTIKVWTGYGSTATYRINACLRVERNCIKATGERTKRACPLWWQILTNPKHFQSMQNYQLTIKLEAFLKVSLWLTMPHSLYLPQLSMTLPLG